ncbi:MAG: biopolymer transporter ExbD [Candidatus Omnitrophica bacterium]|nr:biopolymer transporter ExbD [Candidatus Omnitrophota bacterium]
MNRRQRKQKLVSEINITPFTDVILVLLVIFMVSTPLIYHANIEVKLPEAKSAKPESAANEEKIYITVTSEGIVYLDKEVVTKKTLKERVDALHKRNPQLAVILYADREARFKDVVSVLDVLSQLEITKLDIAALGQQ